ncbi:MAG: alpha/beta hydrolase [Caulobacteraceae bacterium]|nr:alpha/beta hydrolase [Caulobacteraceae bacterium]
MAQKIVHTRRALLGAAAALTAAALLPAQAYAAQDDETTITVSNGRTVTYSIWRPATVRAAIVFSHGQGGKPQNYEALTSAYRDADILIAAPLHVDSQEHPRHAEFDRRAGFGARCEDMGAGFRLLTSLAPNAPLAVSGHSYGGLMSLITAGGLPPAVPAPLAPVKAAVAFSSAGRVPGLINESSYSGLTTPTLMMTGDHDIVEEANLTDWHDHLYPYETSPAGNKMALVYLGGHHNLIGGQQAAGASGPDAMRNGADFILAYAAEDAGAAARVAALQSNDVRQVLRR